MLYAICPIAIVGECGKLCRNRGNPIRSEGIGRAREAKRPNYFFHADYLGPADSKDVFANLFLMRNPLLLMNDFGMTGRFSDKNKIFEIKVLTYSEMGGIHAGPCERKGF